MPPNPKGSGMCALVHTYVHYARSALCTGIHIRKGPRARIGPFFWKHCRRQMFQKMDNSRPLGYLTYGTKPFSGPRVPTATKCPRSGILGAFGALTWVRTRVHVCVHAGPCTGKPEGFTFTGRCTCPGLRPRVFTK